MVLARGTPGFSGADLQNMVKCVELQLLYRAWTKSFCISMAAVQASREGATAVELKHFEWAKVGRFTAAKFRCNDTEKNVRYIGPYSYGR